MRDASIFVTIGHSSSMQAGIERLSALGTAQGAQAVGMTSLCFFLSDACTLHETEKGKKTLETELLGRCKENRGGETDHWGLCELVACLLPSLIPSHSSFRRNS
eukprot:1161566-Pelagomonas_calceolata.AAC.5